MIAETIWKDFWRLQCDVDLGIIGNLVYVGIVWMLFSLLLPLR